MGVELDSTYQRLFNFWLVVLAVVVGIKLWSSASAITVDSRTGGAPRPEAEPSTPIALPDSPQTARSPASDGAAERKSGTSEASEPESDSPEAVSGPDGSELVEELNRADASDLRQISGIGEVISARIVEARERRDGFAELSTVKEVEGIGDSRLKTLQRWLRSRVADSD